MFDPADRDPVLDPRNIDSIATLVECFRPLASGLPHENIHFSLTGSQVYQVSTDFDRITHELAESRRREAALRELAYTDELTGLHNMAAFVAQTDVLLNAGNIDLAVAYLDVNDLKVINDTHGHDAGDAYLKAFANGLRLASNNSRQGFPARLHGDEMAILLPLNDPDGNVHLFGSNAERRSSARDNIIPVVNRAGAITVDAVRTVSPIFSGASVAMGVTVIERGSGMMVGDVLKAADKQMYIAKRQHQSTNDQGFGTISMGGLVQPIIQPAE